MVLYTGRSEWTAPLSVGALLPEDLPEDLLPYQPSQRFALLDEGRCPDELLVDTGNPVTLLLRIRKASEPDQVSEGVVLLAKYFRRLAEANEAESNAEALSRAIQTWLSYEFEQSRFSVDISKANTFEEVCAMVEDRFADWKARMREEGREEGRAEGRAEGRVQGKTEGRTEEHFNTLLSNIKTMMETLRLTSDAAMDALRVTPEERKKILQAL